MKIGVISDTHDNLATLDKFLAYIAKNPVDRVIHCGDVAAGETLTRLAQGFTGKIFVAFGNMDYRDRVREAAKKLPNVTLFEDFGTANLGGLKFGFCHHKETGLAYSQKQKFNYIFYGHTHKPWIEEINGCCFANPGNLSGMIYRSTFALLDTAARKMDLKIVERL
jgi:uncharacterized protein